MNIDWRRVGAAGSVIGGIATMHGLKTRKWCSIHTFGVVLGIAATVAPLVQRARRISVTLHAPERRLPTVLSAADNFIS